MNFFEICAEVLVPKFTRAEVRLPVHLRFHFAIFCTILLSVNFILLKTTNSCFIYCLIKLNNINNIYSLCFIEDINRATAECAFVFLYMCFAQSLTWI